MKKLILPALAAASVVAPAATRAQTLPDATPDGLARRVRELEDRVALKALVDTFSILADRKDIAKQVLLSNFETVYHMNGQQAVTIAGDRATGISYCYVVLVGAQNGRTVR